MLSKEEKQHYSKIKKFFSERDFDKIQMGIDLIQSLNNVNIYDEFLKEVDLEIGWNDIVGANNFSPFKHDWGTTGPDQHYYTTALLGLVNFAPDGSKGEILRNSIEKLSLNGNIKSNYSNEKSKIYVKYLSNFKNLKILILDDYAEIIGFESIYNLEIENLELKRGLTIPEINKTWKFKNLKKLYLDADYKSEDFPSNFELFSSLINLECLYIRSPFYSEKDFSLKGIENLKKLRFLKTAGTGISKLIELKSINSLMQVEFNSERKLISIDGLQNSKDLFSVIFNDHPELESIKPLKEINSLRKIDITSCNKLISLEGLENSNKLIYVNINNLSAIKNLDSLSNTKNLLILNASGCTNLQNINALSNSVNLREINLNGNSSLTDLKGLENCQKLKSIDISSSSIKNLDSINKASIFNNSKSSSNDSPWLNEIETEILDLINDDNIHRDLFNSISIPIPSKCKITLDGLHNNYWHEIARIYYKDRDWGEPPLNEFIVENCPNLASLEGLKNSGIQLLKITNCPKIVNVDYLSEFSKLICVDFEDCSSLISVEGLIDLPIDRLLLGKCYKVKPKPRFLKMDSVEKVTEYFSKFKKKEKTVSVSSANKEIIEKLQKLIISDNYEEINLGLDLASTISEIEIFDYFLNGIKYNGDKILPNPMFLAGTKKLEGFREFALRGMVSISPDGCKAADKIKSQITKESISGSQYSSLFLVSGLTKLESLTIEDTSITLISDLSRLKNLKKLILKTNQKLKSLEGIKSLKSIEEIHILPKESWGSSSAIVDLKGISGLDKLKVLKIYNCYNLLNLNGLENLITLQTFDLRKCQKLNDIESLSKIESLTNISLRECESVSSIKCLEQLPNLNLLDIRFHNITDSKELPKLSTPIIESLRSGTLTF